MDKMTLEQYIVNPMGKNNAVMSGALRETLKRQYDLKFHNLLLRENGKIDYTVYKDETKNTFYFHIKIPSETVENFYYDVIFKFFADEEIKDGGRNFAKYYVQFFSNDPSFVFTYAHTFMKNGLFIKELAPKMSKEAIKNRAVEKNPQDLNGYVKSIYFAYVFLKERGLLARVRSEGAFKFDIRTLLSNIEDADTKIAKRQTEGAKVSKRKKIMVDKSTLNKMRRIGMNAETEKRLVTTTSKIPTIKTNKPVNSSMVKKTKRTKKI